MTRVVRTFFPSVADMLMFAFDFTGYLCPGHDEGWFLEKAQGDWEKDSMDTVIRAVCVAR